MSTRRADYQVDLLQGTLDLLILRTVALGPVHGHAIAKSIEFRSQEVLQVGQGPFLSAHGKRPETTICRNVEVGAAL
jgi:PadR family transcriptional regulator PadR